MKSVGARFAFILTLAGHNATLSRERASREDKEDTATFTRAHTGARSEAEATLQTTLILTSCGGPIVGSGLWTLCSLNVPQRATARTLGVRVVFSQRGYLWSRGPRVYTHTYIHTRTECR